MTASLPPFCWILTEGMIGTENQCLALAQAVGCPDPVRKIVKLKAPWRWVTPYLRHFTPGAMAPGSTPLAGPWPDLLIASGRKAIAAALWVKRQSGNRTVLVIVQSPVVTDRRFDLVLAPRHDRYNAPNAMAVTGALSYLTPDLLAAARADYPQLAVLPAPRLAVLIGGNSRTHRLDDQVADRIIAQLQALQQQGYGLMITASRRTPDAIRQRLATALQHPGTFFWDGTGVNPYRAYLAYSDVILVTEDSVSMASEAISTGKPVYIIGLAGGSPRFQRFHADLIARGYARHFDGTITPWAYDPPDDLARAAAHVKVLLTNSLEKTG